MRKIEQQMMQAIHNKQAWKLANTEVNPKSDGNVDVLLYGNRIADIGRESVTICDCGWQSATTKSRLHVILQNFCDARLYQHTKKWFVEVNDRTQAISTNTNYTLTRTH